MNIKEQEETALLKEEIKAATRLIWAIVHEKGGTVKIPDSVFLKLEDGEQNLETYYDHSDNTTVFVAKIRAIKKPTFLVESPNITPSSTEPDKDGCQDEQSQKLDTDQCHT